MSTIIIAVALVVGTVLCPLKPAQSVFMIHDGGDIDSPICPTDQIEASDFQP